MGRVKLKLKTVESHTGRIVTYSKRKNALLKKANELAVLCEIDVVLLMFSPTGKVALQMRNAKKLDQVIRRFARMSSEERARSKVEVFETLKKSYKNSDHEVLAKYFSRTRSRSVEDLIAKSNVLQEQLADTRQRLSDWRNPDKIEDIELLGQMEGYLNQVFYQIRAKKSRINLYSSSSNVLQSSGVRYENIASISNKNFHYTREPLMGPSTAAYLSTIENAIVENTRGYADNLLQTELLKNELAALQSRNALARSKYLISAYNEAEYSTYDFREEKNNNNLYIHDELGVRFQKQNPCSDQNIVPFQQQLCFQEKSNVRIEDQTPCSEKNIVPYEQHNVWPQQNMEYTFDEGNLRPESSSYDPILEWSTSYDAFDFSLSDSQQPLSVDDYM